MSQNTSVWLISGFSNFCHRHFHYDDIIIIMLYGFSTNRTISYQMKAFLYMLYFVSTRIIFHGKNDVTISLCPITGSTFKIKMYFQRKKFWNVILRQLSSILSHYCVLKPPICHHGDTMCQIKNRIPRCTSVGNFSSSRKTSAI